MLPLFNSSSFVPVPTLSHRTCLHSASSVLGVHISSHIIAMFVFSKPLFTVIMAPRHKSSDDAGSASKPKRSCDVLSISEKVKILDMIEIKKKSYPEIARLYGKNKSSICEVMKNKEKIHASFSIAPQTAKVTAVVRDKMLVKVEKAYISGWKI